MEADESLFVSLTYLYRKTWACEETTATLEHGRTTRRRVAGSGQDGLSGVPGFPWQASAFGIDVVLFLSRGRAPSCLLHCFAKPQGRRRISRDCCLRLLQTEEGGFSRFVRFRGIFRYSRRWMAARYPGGALGVANRSRWCFRRPCFLAGQ